MLNDEKVPFLKIKRCPYIIVLCDGRTALFDGRIEQLLLRSYVFESSNSCAFCHAAFALARSPISS